MPQFIFYACPTGPLAQQLAAYFERTQQSCGPNAAHAYMPHCTLTGFFEDESSAIADYIEALDGALLESRDRIPTPPISIRQMTFRPRWHGLALEAPWLKQLIATLAMRATSPTRREPLRLKDWLHLSLAYRFDPACEPTLRQAASDLIDLSAPVGWELRFYQRSDSRWQCHHCRSL